MAKSIIKENTKRTTKEEFEKYKKDLNKRTILVSINGTLGNIGVFNGEKCFLGKSACYFNVLNEIDKTFIKYIVTDKKFQDYINNFAHGTTIKNVSLKTMREFPFLLPPLPEQKAIAEVLSSLDGKIDLLHRQNKTLEALAETLFRQWFIEEAREDWKEYSLFEAIELIGGGTPKTSVAEYWDGEISWLSGGDITSNHKEIIVSTEKSITTSGLSNSSAKLLPKFSTVISARGTVGKYCILSKPMAFSQSNYGIRPKFTNCFFFTYLLIAHSVDKLQSAAYGSVFDTITTNTFKGHYIILPIEDYIREFENMVSPIFIKMLNNRHQIRTLEKLRDTLLPKLMSGEVRVNNIEGIDNV